MEQRNPEGGQRPIGNRPKSAVRFLRTKLLVLLLLCALPGYGVVTLWLEGGTWVPAAVYVLMSVLTFLLYWHDKHRARNDGQRTPEKILHGAELLGGWPGAFIGQQAFRHKTRKVSYQVVFWGIVVLHELFWIDRLVLGGNFIARHLY
jgi:uncharacterized membrane protein YsdA (DUF1294 family)